MSDDIPPIVHALSGAVASIASNTFTYPLDLVTTRIQTQIKDHKKSRRASGTPFTHEKNYSSVSHALFTIYEDEGVAALYEGLVADNISTMASTFCYHFAYNFIRDRRFEAAALKHGSRPRVLGMFEELMIGATAGVVARFVTSPASNVVTRSQTQGGSTIEIVKSIYREKGITGFWSGMKASVILAANPSISFYLFEVQKALLIPKARRDAPKAFEIFLMSATGKAIATLLLYPVILVKARTQALRIKIGLWQLVKSILEKEGLGGMYAGALPQVVKGFMSQGILMLLKDRIGALIISGYLSIARNRKVQAQGYYFADSPKTDVNGLIAATKDTIEVAVDNAVEKVKEVAGDVVEGSHASELAERARQAAQSAVQTISDNNVVTSIKDAASSAATNVSGLLDNARQSTTNTIQAMTDQVKDAEIISQVSQAGQDVSASASKVVEQARVAASHATETLRNTQVAETTSQVIESAKAIVSDQSQGANDAIQTAKDMINEKPVRAISNAVAVAKSDLKK